MQGLTGKENQDLAAAKTSLVIFWFRPVVQEGDEEMERQCEQIIAMYSNSS